MCIPFLAHACDSDSAECSSDSSAHELRPQWKKRKFLPTYDMFDPFAAKAEQAHLSATQSYYVNQHFAFYIEQGTIKFQILE